MRVLVAEDHAKLAQTVAAGLRREGMAVDTACDGQEALHDALVTSYDVIVPDRDLPTLHGDEVCRRLIVRGCESRILMLTAASTIEDPVAGLGLGADDCLPKPFAFAELVARLRALARRSRPPRGLPHDQRDALMRTAHLRADLPQRQAPGLQPQRQLPLPYRQMWPHRHLPSSSRIFPTHRGVALTI
jgi:DNA-binding response OmpR family regulator